jgi:hypothetical protein
VPSGPRHCGQYWSPSARLAATTVVTVRSNIAIEPTASFLLIAADYSRYFCFVEPDIRILLAIGLFALAQPAPRAIHGIVYDDANRNQTREPNEAGLQGIVVSDQFSVATTAKDGGWKLDAAPGARVVYASVPDGFTPSGAFWRAIPADAAAIELPLTRRQAASEFTFIHASDTHLSAASLPRMKLLRALVEKAKPAFVLITGDLVRDALRVSETEARGYYDMLVAELKLFPVPVWTVPGNHENFGIERDKSKVTADHPLYGKQMYRHYLGPNYYSFAWGGIRFLGLDSVDIDDMWYYGHVDAAHTAQQYEAAGYAEGSERRRHTRPDPFGKVSGHGKRDRA